ncbi:uncharacterized protein METZ01_LOCUS229278, partial [marine metagenome]
MSSMFINRRKFFAMGAAGIGMFAG